METEKLYPHWEEIDEKQFGRLFFTFLFEKQEKKSFLFDENGEELRKPLLFVYVWEMKVCQTKDEKLGVAIHWEKDKMYFHKFGNPESWEERKELLISIALEE